jgi:hypothetical protein
MYCSARTWLPDDFSVTLKKCHIRETGTASAIDEKFQEKSGDVYG